MASDVTDIAVELLNRFDNTFDFATLQNVKSSRLKRKSSTTLESLIVKALSEKNLGSSNLPRDHSLMITGGASKVNRGWGRKKR